MSAKATKTVQDLKRLRIFNAAREMLANQGIDQVQFDEIASGAGVTSLDIEAYASNPSDLVVFVFNQKMGELIEEGSLRINEEASLVDNLVEFSAPILREFSKEVNISRVYLRSNFFSKGLNTEGLDRNRRRKLEVIRHIVNISQERGEIDRNINVDLLAMHLLLLQSASIRRWMSHTSPDPSSGVEVLSSVFMGQVAAIRKPPPIRNRPGASVSRRQVSARQLRATRSR